MHLWKIKSQKSSLKVQIIEKLGDRCRYTGKYRSAAHSICNLKFNVPNETPVVFHDGSNYDYHFIIKKSDFEGIFERLGENTGKFKTLSVPIEKGVTKIKKKDRNESVVSISEKMKFTDSARFIPTSL